MIIVVDSQHQAKVEQQKPAQLELGVELALFEHEAAVHHLGRHLDLDLV